MYLEKEGLNLLSGTSDIILSLKGEIEKEIMKNKKK